MSDQELEQPIDLSEEVTETTDDPAKNEGLAEADISEPDAHDPELEEEQAEEAADAGEPSDHQIDRFQQLRILEALLFASEEPVSEKKLTERMPEDADIMGLIDELTGMYANRGVTLRKIGDGSQGGWAFRTAEDLSTYMNIERVTPKKLSRAAIETMAIIAYHQPVTRAEIEEIRGVAVSRGTIDLLLEAGWIKPRGRKQVPGRPVTWGTTTSFLDEFGLEDLKALPGIEELKAAGLLDSRPRMGISMRESEAELADSDTLEEEGDLYDEDDADDADDPIDADEGPFEEQEPLESVETDESIALDD